MSQNNNTLYDRKEWMHPEDLDLTVPENHVLYLKHLKAYEHALQFVENKTVLEIGCGSGYGNKLLAQKAEKIYSLDIDKESLEFARIHNANSKTEYIEVDVVEGVDLESNSCDICVCFQVIEHIDIEKIPLFLNEIKRIVKPSGITLFTTPNRKIRLYPFQKPVNKYHKTEYTGKGFKKLLSVYFDDVSLFGMQAVDMLKRIEIRRYKPSIFKHFIIFPTKKLLGIKGQIIKKNRLYN